MDATAIAAAPPLRSMPRAEYDAIDAVRFSTLKEMRRSPLHYRYREQNPLEDTPRLMLGRACHTAVLEIERFLLDYALFEGERRAGKVWEAFEAQHADKTILKRPEYDLCLDMRKAVMAHPVAASYLAKGRAEQVVTWTDGATGLACKARLDWICDAPGKAALLDLKTTGCVETTLFASTAARMGYHAQLAFYRQGLIANGLLVPAKIVAVEAAPPHDVAVFDVDEMLHAGDEEVGELLAAVASCRASGEWPGRYGAGEQPLHLPAWFYAAAEDAASTPLGLVIDGQEG
jgi:hypothetical protein